MTFHNLRAFRDPRAVPVAEAFDAWLRDTMSLEADARNRRLIDWERAPGARAAHPREEHLIPLMVATGAAGTDRSHALTTVPSAACGCRPSSSRLLESLPS